MLRFLESENFKKPNKKKTNEANLVAAESGETPVGVQTMQEAGAHLQGPARPRVHQFTPVREAFTRQEIHVAEKTAKKTW